MPWEVLDHTADAGVVVTAESRAGLFSEAVRALTDCITDVGRVRPSAARPVTLVAADLELLLVEWLAEALYLFEVEGFLSAGGELTVVDRGAAGLRLTGELRGEPHDPQRHPHKVAIKAVTYHGLRVEPTGQGWRARVIFDL